jgi:hypothetical protein
MKIENLVAMLGIYTLSKFYSIQSPTIVKNKLFKYKVDRKNSEIGNLDYIM